MLRNRLPGTGVLAFLGLLLASCKSPEPQSPALIMKVGQGYAATKVNTCIFRHHSIVTHDQTQFLAYYCPDAKVVIAHRRLDSADWILFHPGWKGNVRDAHNGISLGISKDGILHVSYDHHGQRLKYRRSRRPLDPTSFGPVVAMTGKRERRVTYPQFVNLADGTLLFFYR